MAKTGRNEPCPCGSGLKFKKCCLPREERAPVRPAAAPLPTRQVFVSREIARLQEQASLRRPGFRLVGALVFFSTEQGDAWILELTEQDAVPVARTGQPLAVTVNETEETFEIGWTYSFAIKGQMMVTTSYLDGAISSHVGCPVREIRTALDNIRRNYSSRELESIRLKES
jgi:hypothetical protein